MEKINNLPFVFAKELYDYELKYKNVLDKIIYWNNDGFFIRKKENQKGKNINTNIISRKLLFDTLKSEYDIQFMTEKNISDILYSEFGSSEKLDNFINILYIHLFRIYKDGKYLETFKKYAQIKYLMYIYNLSFFNNIFKTNSKQYKNISLLNLVNLIEKDEYLTQIDDDIIVMMSIVSHRKHYSSLLNLKNFAENIVNKYGLKLGIFAAFYGLENPVINLFLLNDKIDEEYKILSILSYIHTTKLKKHIYDIEYFLYLSLEIIPHFMRKKFKDNFNICRDISEILKMTDFISGLYVVNQDKNILNIVSENIKKTRSRNSCASMVLSIKNKTNPFYKIINSFIHDTEYFIIINGLLTSQKNKIIMSNIFGQSCNIPKLIDIIFNDKIFSIYPIKTMLEIGKITKSSILGNISEDLKQRNIEIMYIQKILFFLGKNKILNNPQKWNETLNWFIKHSKRIWQEHKNSDQVTDYLDYIYAHNTFGITEFNDKMSFLRVHNNSIAWHELSYRNNNDEERNVVFPKPWIKGFIKDDIVITPLTNPDMLIHEGIEMHHCVGTYCREVSKNVSYIYSVIGKNKKDRATVELKKTTNTISISQIRSYHNTEPSKKVINIVKEWLNDVTIK